MFSNTNRVRVLGHVVDYCSKCNDKLPIELYHKQWLCSDCLRIYKRSLSSVSENRDSERQKERFHKIVDNANN
jgi:hypothetical protein